MELENRTRYPAYLYRGCIDEQRIAASLVIRKTFDLVGDVLHPAQDQLWIVSGGPWKSPYGQMAADELFYRGGVDVFVLGSACAAGNKPTSRVDVHVEVGDNFKHSIAVFGDRTWQQRNGGMAPSEPKLFTAIPLNLAHAFGGKDEWDELPIPFADNPDGKGFYIEEKNAVGKPLPNIENPNQLIRKWDDRPEPVGVGLTPIIYGPRMTKSVEIDEQTGQITKLHATYFNAAFPAMIAPKMKPGTRVRVRGVTPKDPIEFNVPPSGTKVRFAFGEQVKEIDPPIDQIGIEADARRVFITYRYPFRYEIVALVKRSCELLPVEPEGALS